jgi:large subunit ribosomal protein L10
MENPRPEKVAVVEEIRGRLEDADATVLTEYRGLDMTSIQTLRRALRDAGADYKVYKNTLARFAARDAGLDIEDQLVGPTAFAFTATKADGSPGDPVMLAKALKEFAKTNEALIIKGGLMDGALLSSDDVKALAEVAPREELLAQFAGLLAAPMQRFAGLLAAVPRDFAYGLQALIDKQGGVPDTAEDDGGAPDAAETPDAEPEASDAPDDTSASDEASASADVEVDASTDAPTDEASTEAPEPDGGDDAPAPDESEEA